MNRRDFLTQSAVGTAALGLSAETLAAPAPDKPAGKKSLLWGMLPAKLSIEDRFKLAKDTGFAGVEAPPFTDETECKNLRAASEKVGVPVHSVIFGGWDAPLSHPDLKVQERGVEKVKAGLQGAKWMGAENILLVPAIVDAQTRYVDAYKRSQANVRKCIPTAEKLGMMILIEEVWNNFLLSPMEFARYVDDFKHPLVQAYFDVGNVVTFGWPEDWIRTLGKRIKRVHIKDYKGGPGLFGGNKGSFVNIREGNINWSEVTKAFGEIGYSGWMTLELGGGDEAYLRDLSERFDKILVGQ